MGDRVPTKSLHIKGCRESKAGGKHLFAARLARKVKGGTVPGCPNRDDILAILESLSEIIVERIKEGEVVEIPGICKIALMIQPGRKGKWANDLQARLKGQEDAVVWQKPRPACKRVVIEPTKSFVDTVFGKGQWKGQIARRARLEIESSDMQ
jgi:nucleoid DNA-binding protein